MRVVNPEEHLKLPAFINETVLGKRIPEVCQQPWRFVGLSQFPTALDDIASSLSEIEVVLVEKATSPRDGGLLLNAAQSGPHEKALTRAAEFARQRVCKRNQVRRRRVEADLESTGLVVEVFWFDGNRLKGEIPNLGVAVLVETLFAWPTVVEQLLPILEFHQESGEAPVLVPVLSGKTVRRCALQLLSHRLWPVSDWERFETSLLDSLEERLILEVDSALTALAVCSGLSTLGNEADLDERVRKVLEEAFVNFSKSIEKVLAMGEDALISALAGWLHEMALKVKAEWDDENEPGTFTGDLEEVSLGVENINTPELICVIFHSLHWDAGPMRIC